jgi:uncharacterized membrane protein YdjX (TVP38/TMEM64 family)
MKAFLKRHGRWIGGILIVGLIVLLAKTVPLVDWLERMATPLREMGWLGVALYALIYFVAGLLCLPCAPITLAGGYILGTAHGVIAVHTGCVLSAAAGFLLGRWLGRRHAAEWMRNSPRFHQLDDAIAEEGWKIVGLLRLQAIPFGLSNYLYGMTKIDFWHYILATFVAMLPGHLIYVHIGAVGGKHLSGKGGDIGPLEVIAPALGVISMILVTYMLTRMVKKHQARHAKAAARG